MRGRIGGLFLEEGDRVERGRGVPRMARVAACGAPMVAYHAGALAMSRPTIAAQDTGKGNVGHDAPLVVV